MVAVWRGERAMLGLFNARAVVLMCFSFECVRPLVGVSVSRAFLGQSEECFFQTCALNLKAGELRVASQQFANDRFGFDSVNLDGFAIFFYFGHAGNLA